MSFFWSGLSIVALIDLIGTGAVEFYTYIIIFILAYNANILPIMPMSKEAQYHSCQECEDLFCSVYNDGSFVFLLGIQQLTFI